MASNSLCFSQVSTPVGLTMHAYTGHTKLQKDVMCAHSHRLRYSMLHAWIFCVCVCVWISRFFKDCNVQNKLLTNNSTTKAKKWTQFSSVTVAQWLIRCFYLLSKGFPPPTFKSGFPRGKMAKWKTFNTFTMTGFPLDKRNCTYTHTDHTYLPKGSPCRWAGSFFITLAQRNQVCSNGAQSHWAKAMEG